jgi:CYTH domain-containing protein/predicted ATPase
MEQASVYRIVLTGGPCGGKSTSLAAISDRLQGLGFRVYRVPEAATLLLGGGVSVHDASPEQLLEIQAQMLRVIMALEDAFCTVACATGQRSVLLCDRGTMDVSAYLRPEVWSALLNEHEWTVVGLRDRRYEAVLHLVTAADGAEPYYTTENNAVRTETPAQARALDKQVRDAWLGHPRLRVIDNSTDFARKVQRVSAAVCQLVGAPEPEEIERKFLLRQGSVQAPIPTRFEEFDIEQTYLLGQEGLEARLRRRGQHGSYTYTYTLKRPVALGQRVEIARQITGREYLSLLCQSDPARRTIKKRRRVFLWENRYFEWDIFVDPRPGLELLEIELDSLTSAVGLPPFLNIEREVTGDAEYANYWIALAEPAAGRSSRGRESMGK